MIISDRHFATRWYYSARRYHTTQYVAFTHGDMTTMQLPNKKLVKSIFLLYQARAIFCL